LPNDRITNNGTRAEEKSINTIIYLQTFYTFLKISWIVRKYSDDGTMITLFPVGILLEDFMDSNDPLGQLFSK
jgi:hypothetical protein